MVLIRSDVTHRTPWLGDREDTGGVRVLSGLCFAAAVMTACTGERAVYEETCRVMDTILAL